MNMASRQPGSAIDGGPPGFTPAGPAPYSEGRFLRILVVEDNPVNQIVATRMLAKLGHRSATAANGREALAALAAECFDLVLMDIQMPEMDGVQATAMVRRREEAQGGHLPIIAMTACAVSGDRERFLGCGMDGYVAKPVRMVELAEAIEAAAGIRRA